MTDITHQKTGIERSVAAEIVMGNVQPFKKKIEELERYIKILEAANLDYLQENLERLRNENPHDKRNWWV